MDAGRELDALVAEHVTRLLDVYEQHGELMFDGGIRMPVPAYSTTIAAAWTVIEVMERRGFWAEMRTPFGEPFSALHDGYWCGYTPHGISGWNGIPDHHTQAATLPLAICLAALAAVSVEVP